MEGSKSICVKVIYFSEEGETTAGNHNRVSGYGDRIHGSSWYFNHCIYQLSLLGANATVVRFGGT